jgi:hypothetical protein
MGEIFPRRNQIENGDGIAQNANLTIPGGKVLTGCWLLYTARYFDFLELNLAREVWGDIFPDIFGVSRPLDKIKDIIIKYTYERFAGSAYPRTRVTP